MACIFLFHFKAVLFHIQAVHQPSHTNHLHTVIKWSVENLQLHFSAILKCYNDFPYSTHRYNPSFLAWLTRTSIIWSYWSLPPTFINSSPYQALHLALEHMPTSCLTSHSLHILRPVAMLHVPALSFRSHLPLEVVCLRPLPFIELFIFLYYNAPLFSSPIALLQGVCFPYSEDSTLFFFVAPVLSITPDPYQGLTK